MGKARIRPIIPAPDDGQKNVAVYERETARKNETTQRWNTPGVTLLLLLFIIIIYYYYDLYCYYILIITNLI
jgi:hypothetical protein